MNHFRRYLLATSAIAVFLVPTFASAQTDDAASYPRKPIRFIVPLSAGGIADVMSRMVANDLNTRWGQPVVVENRPGAGTALGLPAVHDRAPVPAPTAFGMAEVDRVSKDVLAAERRWLVPLRSEPRRRADREALKL